MLYLVGLQKYDLGSAFIIVYLHAIHESIYLVVFCMISAQLSWDGYRLLVRSYLLTSVPVARCFEQRCDISKQ